MNRLAIIFLSTIGIFISLPYLVPHNNTWKINRADYGEPNKRPSPQAAPYRDIYKNGRMDIYEDIHQPIELRIKDLLAQMTLEEKAGLLFINGARVNEDGFY